jgi:hypothetical protein
MDVDAKGGGEEPEARSQEPEYAAGIFHARVEDTLLTAV